MRYAIIKHAGCQELVAHVNACIRDGWRPLGGVAYSGGEYAQAMAHDVMDAEVPATKHEPGYLPHAWKVVSTDG